MIVDFTIKNFRSIKEEQTFSMFAESSSKYLSKNIKFYDDGEFGVLKTAGVYGANASGKSNVLLAFEALRYIICKSGDLKDGDEILCYDPYLLSPTTKTAPVEFEVEFMCGKHSTRYIYKVSFTRKKIISESLDFYPSSRPANLFYRAESDTWESMKLGGYYKGSKRRFAFFDNNSYISKAGNSADSPKVARDVFNYFRLGVMHLGMNERINSMAWASNEAFVKEVSGVLSKVDTGIFDIGFKEKDPSEINIPKSIPEDLRKTIIASESTQPVFYHKNSSGALEEFTEDMESEGTNKLFDMLPMLIIVLKAGGVMIIDELDNSFHPHLAELIIKLFNDPKTNLNNGQLIFSTHNVALMSPSLFRRDQIWLTEKFDGETSLVSLEEYDKETVKIDSPFDKWYSEGRLGGTPQIDIEGIKRILRNEVKEGA